MVWTLNIPVPDGDIGDIDVAVTGEF